MVKIYYSKKSKIAESIIMKASMIEEAINKMKKMGYLYLGTTTL